MSIGNARLLDIKVILDDKEAIYEGLVDEAPQYIKNLKYSNVEMGSNKMIYYVYSDCN